MSGRLIGACLNFDARSEEAAPLYAQRAVSRNVVGSHFELICHRQLKERKTETKARKKRIADGKEEAPMYVVEFLDAVEEPLKEAHIPQGKGNFLYTSLFGTAAHISTAENVQASQHFSTKIVYNAQPTNQVAIFIAKENIRIAMAQGFQGIFTTNTNRLTQLISRSLGYQILSTIQVEFSNIKTNFSCTQVNQYEDKHGVRPFAAAPDDLVTEVALKRF